MAFYDWNHNGKKDVADYYIEYQIYKESTSNTNYNNVDYMQFGIGGMV